MDHAGQSPVRHLGEAPGRTGELLHLDTRWPQDLPRLRRLRRNHALNPASSFLIGLVANFDHEPDKSRRPAFDIALTSQRSNVRRNFVLAKSLPVSRERRLNTRV